MWVLHPYLPQEIPIPAACASVAEAGADTRPCGAASVGADRDAVAGSDTAGRDAVCSFAFSQSPSLSSVCPLGQVLAIHSPFDAVSVLAHSSGQTRDG